MLIQLTGMSGAGKSTISEGVKRKLSKEGYTVEILDGDCFRQNLCRDLGFSKEDRLENIRRLGLVGHLLSRNGIICIIAAINPFDEVRRELKEKYNAKTVYLDCEVEILKERDTKGLYLRTRLPENDPNKIKNLSGINDTFEIPASPDLEILTSNEDEGKSVERLYEFIKLLNVKDENCNNL